MNNRTIEVSESVYERLTKQIKDFGETPNSVIERLLNGAEGKRVKPSVIFYPEGEARFQALLLRDKKAEVALFKQDGSVEVIVWNASKLKESSNIKANIWSGYLRNWEDKGIIKAEFSIYDKPVDAMRGVEFFELCERLASLVNVPYRILKELEFEHSIEDEGGVKALNLNFHDGQNLSLLEGNKFFNPTKKCISAYEHEIGSPL